MKVIMNSLHKVKAEEILELLQESKQEMFRFMSSFGEQPWFVFIS